MIGSQQHGVFALFYDSSPSITKLNVLACHWHVIEITTALLIISKFDIELLGSQRHDCFALFYAQSTSIYKKIECFFSVFKRTVYDCELS